MSRWCRSRCDRKPPEPNRPTSAFRMRPGGCTRSVRMLVGIMSEHREMKAQCPGANDQGRAQSRKFQGSRRKDWRYRSPFHPSRRLERNKPTGETSTAGGTTGPRHHTHVSPSPRPGGTREAFTNPALQLRLTPPDAAAGPGVAARDPPACRRSRCPRSPPAHRSNRRP
ncbi:MAG: hypothetical protein CJBNEKGG_01687 [Prosthecobacter sp.]|nr:hypothetical protein [Prosthecobacter sp.]